MVYVDFYGTIKMCMNENGGKTIFIKLTIK